MISNLFILTADPLLPRTVAKRARRAKPPRIRIAFLQWKEIICQILTNSLLHQQTPGPGADESAGCGSPQLAGLGAGGVGVPGALSTAALPGLSPPGGGLCQKHCSTGGGKPDPGSRAPWGR